MSYGTFPYGQPAQPPFGQPPYQQPQYPQPAFGPQGQWYPAPAPQIAQPAPTTPVPPPEPRKAEFCEFDLEVSTTDSLPGRTITEVVGPVFGVALRPRDNRPAPDLVGLLIESRQQAVRELVAMAQAQGADAVVGLTFDIAMAAENLQEVCAYATAVLVEADAPLDESELTSP